MIVIKSVATHLDLEPKIVMVELDTPATPDLNQLIIRTPCTMDWEQMDGDAKSRHCEKCSLQVYNFAEMTRSEISEAIGDGTDRVCARLYQREDGTIVTAECPSGILKRKGRWQFSVRSVLAATVAFATLFCAAPALAIVLRPLIDRLTGSSQPTPLMGDVVSSGVMMGKVTAPNQCANPNP